MKFKVFLFHLLAVLSLSRNVIGWTKPCGENPIPGLIPMEAGYDITNYEVGREQERAREQLFDYTCNNKNRFIGNFNYNFTYPDQFYTPMPKFMKNSKEEIVKNFEQLIQIKRSYIKTSDKYEYFANLANVARAAAKIPGQPEVGPEFDKICNAVGAISLVQAPPQESTLEDYVKFLQSSESQKKVDIIDINAYELLFKSPDQLTLREDFKKSYMELPASFIKNPEPFLSFIQRFGTHYMLQGGFGGRFQHSKNGQNEQAQFLGGDVNLIQRPFTPKALKPWEDSVFANPSIIRVSFVPIAHLISNQSVSFQVAQAILYHVNKRTLDSYGKLMNIINPREIFEDDRKAEYDKQLMEFAKFLYSLRSFNDPKHYVNVLTMNTAEIQSKVNALANFFQSMLIKPRL